jgi:hypothetical protein
MPQTPHDFGGPLQEDEVQFRDQYGTLPSQEGGMLYSDGYFYAEDSYGVFNLRQGAAAGGGITELEHEDLDTLVHNISEDSYDVITYSGSRITNITTFTDSSQTTRIRDCDVAYQPTSIRISQVTTRQYDAAGVLKETETEDVGYDAFGRLKTIDRNKVP